MHGISALSKFLRSNGLSQSALLRSSLTFRCAWHSSLAPLGRTSGVSGLVTPPKIARYSNSSHHRAWTSSIGAEPGINPAENEYMVEDAGHGRHSESEVLVIDYSDSDLAEHHILPEKFEGFLRESARPQWASTRWIYVNGLDWDVVRCLGKWKALHPLAIEDVMDAHTPTKVDWYERHLYLEMKMLKLVHQNHGHSPAGVAEDPVSTLVNNRIGSRQKPKWRTLSPNVGMSAEQVSAFLLDDNTVITVFEKSGSDVLIPILSRLRSAHTVVRSSNDPSMLLQAVIDAVVDISLPIGRAVGDAFEELELEVLSRPTIAQSKNLHVLRSGLALLAENTTAVSGLIRTLCDHRALPAALAERHDHSTDVNGGAGRSEADGLHMKTSTTKQSPANSVQISPLSQVYLQDVQDHCQGLANSTRMQMRSAEHLTTLIFNTIASSQNESVRKLTLVSSFFLPLTFLTGYFGMNFDPMPVVNNNSDTFFWYIATPVMLTTMLLMMARPRWYRPSSWRRRRLMTRPKPPPEQMSEAARRRGKS